MGLAEVAEAVLGPGGKAARKRWAALIKQVYETDPLICPKCGGEMKIIRFIDRNQQEVIEKILKHCELWEEESARAPPEPERDGFENPENSVGNFAEDSWD